MSKRMVDTFFPACLDHINGRRFLSFLYHDVVLPEAVAQQCPEYLWHVNVMEWNIRQPSLLLAALWGIVIGMTGFWQLQPTKFLWAVALLTFGIMNLSAIFVHCFWPAPSRDYPTDYPVLWVVDTYMTGVSGSCLFMASLQELHDRWAVASSRSQSRNFGGHSLVGPGAIFQTTHILIQLIGFGCIAWFVLDPIPFLAAASHPLELWYLVPPILAGGPVLVVLYEEPLWHYFGTILRGSNSDDDNGDNSVSLPNWSLSKSQVIFVWGIIAAGVVGLVMDRFWCPLLGYSFARDVLSANTMVFLGCDLAFWGIASFLVMSNKSKQS